MNTHHRPLNVGKDPPEPPSQKHNNDSRSTPWCGGPPDVDDLEALSTFFNARNPTLVSFISFSSTRNLMAYDSDSTKRHRQQPTLPPHEPNKRFHAESSQGPNDADGQDSKLTRASFIDLENGMVVASTLAIGSKRSYLADFLQNMKESVPAPKKRSQDLDETGHSKRQRQAAGIIPAM